MEKNAGYKSWKDAMTQNFNLLPAKNQQSIFLESQTYIHLCFVWHTDKVHILI